jgi:hypothetical protein
MRAMEAARKTLDPSRFLEIKYETFCEQPLDAYRRILAFSELPEPGDSRQRVEAASIRKVNNRWREDLTVGQQRLLDELLREDLLRYGYAAAAASEAIGETVGR